MGREGMVCLPLVSYGEEVGLLVLGLDERDYPHLEKQSRLLSLFAGQVASAFHVDQMRENRMKAIQKERIKACSTLARKVFHEVNNPLGIIKNYLRILGMKLSKLDVSHDEIPIISEEIDRVALILRQLATFTEESALGHERVDINGLLTNLTKIVEESLQKASKVALHLDLEPQLPFVKASKNGLKQVFINLIKNATDAMTQGGNLSIKTRYVDLSTTHVDAKEKDTLKGYVEITVSDDGPGIPDDILSRLFEPFVTSKGEGHSGLGLSIVHSLIQGFGGHIFCESTVDKGTTFKIEFPLGEKV
jgi:signal transduction histidine kinase